MKFIFFIFVLCSFSCNIISAVNCCEHVSTNSISKGLYLERYRTFCGGALTSDNYDCYITDSISFRQRVGDYDDDGYFDAKLNGNKIETYNIQSSLVPDTVAKKTISKSELWKYHHTAKNCLSLTPVFGKNTIKCDSDFYPAWSSKTNDGYYIAEVQYKCGNDYLNAVFYTDSSNFCIFIGVYDPGSSEINDNYSVQLNNGNFDFYNVTYRHKTDITQVQSYLLSDLKKGSLINVCNSNKRKK